MKIESIAQAICPKMVSLLNEDEDGLKGEKKKIEVKGDKEVKDDSCIPMNSVSLLFFYHIQ
jgi:hypothetical protein